MWRAALTVDIHAAPLTFLHLSDLHITEQGVGSPYDLDFDIRSQLERDLLTQADSHRPWAGVIVTGDIAASGKQLQFEKAAQWFRRLTELLGCPPEDVWTVPGNHDIDRAAFANTPELLAWHVQLRSCPLNELDQRLRALELGANEGLMAPLHNYIRFATRYGCSIGSLRPFWTDDLLLNDGSVLRMHGLTSVLISDALDDDGANKLVIGAAQAQISTGNGVTGLVLSHHPLNWIRDAEVCRDYFGSRSSLQLYGHKHTHFLSRMNDSVIVEAGALHPERVGVWEPHYNIVSLQVVMHNDSRTLQISVQPRIWFRNETRFGPQYGIAGSAENVYPIPLQPWTPPATIALPAPEAIEVTNAIEDSYDGSGGSIMNRERRLAYRLAQMPRLAQLRIAILLGLITDDDRHLRTSELVNRVIAQAQELRRMAQLWDEIEARYPDKTPGANPFEEDAK